MDATDVKKEQLVRITNLLPDFRTIDLDYLLYCNRKVGLRAMVCYPVNATFNRRWVVIHENGTYGIYHHDEMVVEAQPLLDYVNNKTEENDNYHSYSTDFDLSDY